MSESSVRPSGQTSGAPFETSSGRLRLGGRAWTRSAARAFQGAVGKMPWLTKICCLWLILVILAAALADLIPGLADPNYQGSSSATARPTRARRPATGWAPTTSAATSSPG